GISRKGRAAARPVHHAARAALWSGVPALACLILWRAMSGPATSPGWMPAMLVSAILVLGAFLALRSITAETKARHQVERALTLLMMGASAIAILTTIGIF